MKTDKIIEHVWPDRINKRFRVEVNNSWPDGEWAEITAGRFHDPKEAIKKAHRYADFSYVIATRVIDLHIDEDVIYERIRTLVQ